MVGEKSNSNNNPDSSSIDRKEERPVASSSQDVAIETTPLLAAQPSHANDDTSKSRTQKRLDILAKLEEATQVSSFMEVQRIDGWQELRNGVLGGLTLIPAFNYNPENMDGWQKAYGIFRSTLIEKGIPTLVMMELDNLVAFLILKAIDETRFPGRSLGDPYLNAMRLATYGVSSLAQWTDPQRHLDQELPMCTPAIILLSILVLAIGSVISLYFFTDSNKNLKEKAAEYHNHNQYKNLSFLILYQMLTALIAEGLLVMTTLLLTSNPARTTTLDPSQMDMPQALGNSTNASDKPFFADPQILTMLLILGPDIARVVFQLLVQCFKLGVVPAITYGLQGSVTCGGLMVNKWNVAFKYGNKVEELNNSASTNDDDTDNNTTTPSDCCCINMAPLVDCFRKSETPT